MALLGIRDISNLETPPPDRKAIETRISRWDDTTIRQAIRRELNRDGQVYFVHNKIYDIQSVADRIQALVPDARILIGHGRMTGEQLEKAMLAFVRHEADVLVATTIIESGLDIPNANTIFIHEADRYGPGRPPPAPGPGRSLQASRLCLHDFGREPRPSPPTPSAASRRSRSSPTSAPASRSPCATWRSAAPATSSAPSSPATSRPSATSSTARCSNPPSAASPARGSAPGTTARSTSPGAPTCRPTTSPRISSRSSSTAAPADSGAPSASTTSAENSSTASAPSPPPPSTCSPRPNSASMPSAG